MALTPAQKVTLLRLRSGTRYQMRGDKRYGIEVRFRIASRDRDDISCPSLAPLMRNGYIEFCRPPEHLTRYYEVILTARGEDAIQRNEN